MPKHDIEAALPAHRILNTDVQIVVKSDGRLLGELRVSKGTIDWRPGRHQYTVRLSWEKFARLMERVHDGEVR
jgi:hypothetical protein